MAVIKSDGQVEHNFTIVPNDLARDPNISLKAKGVYLYMRSHSEGWSISTTRIAEALGVSRDTVMKSVRELEQVGYLEREQEKAKSGKFGNSVYLLRSMPLPKKPSTVPTGETLQTCRSEPLPKKPSTEKPFNGISDNIRKPIPKKNTLEEEQEDYCAPAGARESGSRYPKDFEDWYSLWPRKKSKGDALKAFRQAKKKISVQELMERTRLITEAWQQQGKDPQYIPYPASWLRADGWEDDIAEPPKRNSNSFLEFSQALRSVTDDQRAIS